MKAQSYYRQGQQGKYDNERDALTGQRLDPGLVDAGRKLEMAFIHEWRVYDYAEFDECLQNHYHGAQITESQHCGHKFR